MTNKIINNEIEKLVTICRTEESKILIAKYQLCLNQSLINLIYDNKQIINNNNNEINYLRQLLRKSPSIKIIGDKSRLNSTTNLLPFVSCVSLELIRISFEKIIGLENIRSQLKCLTCVKTFDSQVIDEQFWDLFGVWPLLTTLKLCHNNIISINASIIPSSVQTLDLSWNRIKEFNNIANYSVNSITKLDLSYNCLNVLPKLNNITSSTLKTLYLRSNLIESIDGIEKLLKLEVLDISINCLINLNSVLSSLKQCKSLNILWIDSNPFSFQKNINDFIKQELSQLSQLDGINISNNNNTGIFDKLDSVKHSENILSDKKVIKMNCDEESDELFVASNDSQIDLNGIKSNSKKKKLRVVKINDQKYIDEDLENININENKFENLYEDKESIIQKRKEFGDEWLVSLRPSFGDKSVLSSAIETNTSLPSMSSLLNDNNSIDLSLSPPIAESTPKVDDSSHEIEQNYIDITHDDDIEVIVPEKSEWSRNELENDTNIIIVECPDTNENIFIYVREDGMIFEKDFSGKLLTTHDLKVLTSVEIINNSILKLCFDSRVNSKRERKYIFDGIDSCQSFNDTFITPWISRRRSSPQTVSEEVLYECLKCGLNKMSEFQINCCPNCNSDAMMRNENRRRRSGSDITILSPQQISTETTSNTFEETNVWDEIYSINSDYNNNFFTRVDHNLKLYIEFKLISGPSGDDEVVEGLVECKSMTGLQNKLESSYFVITSKTLMIITINENEKNGDFESNLKLNLSKPISSLVQIKHLPNLLNSQGFWLQWREDNKEQVSKSRSKSFVNIFGSRKTSLTDTTFSYSLIIFDDELIAKSFLNYFIELINVPQIASNNQKILINNKSNDEPIIINMIKSADYKRNDMKSELNLIENIAIIVTEEYIILGELCFDPNFDFKIKVLYKELIINLIPQISISIKYKNIKLLFSDENIETQFNINLSTTDSMKKILAPIKSQWEKAYDVSLPLLKL